MYLTGELKVYIDQPYNRELFLDLATHLAQVWNNLKDLLPPVSPQADTRKYMNPIGLHGVLAPYESLWEQSVMMVGHCTVQNILMPNRPIQFLDFFPLHQYMI